MTYCLKNESGNLEELAEHINRLFECQLLFFKSPQIEEGDQTLEYGHTFLPVCPKHEINSSAFGTTLFMSIC